MKKGGGMKLAIIYPDQEGWTVDRFRESAHNRGISVQTVAITDELLATGQVDMQIADADAVLWKFADATLAGFLASYPILRHKVLINTGVTLMPSATDKFLQQQLLQRSSLSEYAIPTYRVRNGEHVELLVENGALTYPLIIKPAWGTNAQGVHIISSADDLVRVEKWHSQIVEPFIPSNKEWRVFVVGGAVAGIMKKHRRDGANPTKTIIGGGARNVAEHDVAAIDQLSDIAEKVASLFHLEYAGIDIVQDEKTKQFCVYEANSAAGWQNGFVEATGEDIPGQVLDWFEERLVLKQEGGTAQSVRDYLIKRSHRLPLIDELLLVSGLFITLPESSLFAKYQQLMGEGYINLRAAIEQAVNTGDSISLRKVKEVLKNIRRHHTVEEHVIVGEALYKRFTAINVDRDEPGDEDGITEQNLTSWVNRLRSRQEIALVEKIDRVIGRQLMQLPLDVLIDFALVARQVGVQSLAESAILSRAESSVSWAGNFLIDEKECAVGVSTAHTIRQGYEQSVRYLQLVSLVEHQGL